jgi:hypothetical protein
MTGATKRRHKGGWSAIALTAAAVVACGSGKAGSGDGGSGAVDGSGPDAHSAPPHDGATGRVDAHAATPNDGATDGSETGPRMSPPMSPCPSLQNDAGQVTAFAWPNAMNDGNNTFENQTIRFTWADDSSHNVIQVAGWWGQSLPDAPMPLGMYANASWPNELTSGAPVAEMGHTFDWNTGLFPCGWRPGLYYLADQNTASSGIVVWSITVPEATSSGQPNPVYAPKSCAMLSDPTVYEARYASYASRPNCMQYEVNNFQTNSGYDYVSPAFGANQGDLILVRWTGLHNVIQVENQSHDEPYADGGISSGGRSNCVGGPNYSCVNGPPSLGEYLIDTTNYRPGIIHFSDQCAYSACKGTNNGATFVCPTACDPTKQPNFAMYYGTPFQVGLTRPVRPSPPEAGACCAIDPTKGKACRVIDVYNDNPGTQFDSGIGGTPSVNYGDLIRFRWAGGVKVVQTKPSDSAGDSSQTPWPGGAAMPAAVSCVPGADWTCLGGNTDEAEWVFDVAKAIDSGAYSTFSYGQDYLNFYAFADNTGDPYNSTQDSAMTYPIVQSTPYTNNPACN